MRFFLGEVENIHEVSVRCHHEMPVVVGVLVHDNKVPSSSIQNQSLFIFFGMVGNAKHAGVRFGSKNIVYAPRAPKMFHAFHQGVAGRFVRQILSWSLY